MKIDRQQWKVFDCPGDKASEELLGAVLQNLKLLRQSENRHPEISIQQLSEARDNARSLDARPYPRVAVNVAFRNSHPIAASFGITPSPWASSTYERIRESCLHCLGSYFFLPEARKPKLGKNDLTSINLLVKMTCDPPSRADDRKMLENLNALFPRNLTSAELKKSVNAINNSTSLEVNDYRKSEALIVLNALIKVYEEPKPDSSADTIKTTEKPKKKRKTQASSKGHHIRFKGLVGGCSAEALPSPEAHHAMSWLLNRNPKTDAKRAATLLTIAEGITGLSHDFLLNKILGNETAGPLMRVDLCGTYLVIAKNHIIEDRLPDADSLPASEVATTVTITYPLPRRHWMVSAQDYLRNTPSEKHVLKAKRKLNKKIRKHVSWFTDEKFRAAMVQAILGFKLDLPLTQLLTGEALQNSTAALHYIAFDKAYGEATLNAAIKNLYGSLLPSKAAISELRFGAPKAGVPRSVVDSALEKLWQKRRIAKSNCKHPNKLFKKHQLLAEAALGTLLITSSHRDAEAILDLTVHDISLSDQLVVQRDKRTSPDRYRRLSVLPDIARHLTEEYLDFLRIELDKKRFDEFDDYYRQIDSALSGKGPMFFSAPDNQDLVVTTLLRDLYGVDMPMDIHRHVCSTELRKLNAPPVLIESHLGHNRSMEIVGTNGVMSPLELSEQLLPFLNRLFPCPNNHSIRGSGTQPELSLSAKELHSLMEQEEDDDNTEFWSTKDCLSESFKGSDLDELTTHIIQQVCPAAISSPSTSEITIRDTKLMRQKAFGYCHGDLSRTVELLASLWKQLKLLRIEGAKVALPNAGNWAVRPAYPINRAHLAAHTQLEKIRRLFGNSLERLSPYEIFIHALVIYGNCPSYTKAKECFAAARSADAVELGKDALIFPFNKDESRTIAGAVLECFKGLTHQKRIKKPRSLDFSWCGSLSSEDIETTAHYARSITTPDFILEFINEESPHKEGSVGDLTNFLTNGIRGDGTQPPSNSKDDTINFVAPDADNKFDFQTQSDVDEVVRIARNSSRARKQREFTLDNWLTGDISPLGFLLGKWAIDLLQDGANRRTGKTLADHTIAQYINTCGRLLAKALANRPPIEYDAEELYELVLDNLHPRKSHAYRQSIQLNRFLQFVHDQEWSSLVVLPTKDNPQPIIRSHLVSESELTAAKLAIENWSREDNLRSKFAVCAAYASQLLNLYFQTGVRRSEFQRMYRREVFSDGKVTTVRIGSRKERSLKSDNAKRYVTCSDLRQYLPEKTPMENYLFPLLNDQSFANRTNAIIVRGLRAATGESGSSVHSLRHTFATTGVINVISTKDAAQRLCLREKLMVEAGHGNIQMTLTQYSHATHYANALRLADRDMATWSDKELAIISGKSVQSIKQKRYRERNQSLGRGKRTLPTDPARLAKQATAPSFILPTCHSSHILSLPELTQLLADYCRGAALLDAKHAEKLGISTLTEIVGRTIETSKIYRFDLITRDALERDLELLSRQSYDALQGRKAERYIDTDWIDARMSSMPSDETGVINVLLTLQQSLSITADGDTRFKISDPQQAAHFNRQLNHIGIACALMTGTANTYTLKPLIEIAQSSRCTILVIIFAARMLRDVNRAKTPD